jgi:pyruvate dehydrogenase E2 component (dihydrolipoamide acetyltransferase)
VKEGDKVSSGDIIAEIETDKATMEFEAVDEGTLGKIIVPEGSEGVKVNALIAVLLEDGEQASDAVLTSAPADDAGDKAAATAVSTERATLTTAPTPVASAALDGTRIFASPLARRIAAEKGLDLSALKGSGPHGRIVKADILAAGSAPAKPAPAAIATETPAPAPSVSSDTIAKIYADREFTEIPLDGMRKTIAARLTEAKQTIPHFYLRRDIKIDNLLSFRGQLNKQLEARGVKLSVNDFIIKACALALQTVPAANAVWAGDRVLQLTPSDVAVAVAIEGGLFTPVLKDAEQKSLSTLSAEMKDLATRARSKKTCSA